mmetsp:Transcript_30554/g.60472  ORF Transcript_30554/g.60472 Transcript_30554/m.60472 type:complete len:799 (-) Transcript_30554:399-2795(-)
MWKINSFNIQNAFEAAKQLAEGLENDLDESVGLPGGVTGDHSAKPTAAAPSVLAIDEEEDEDGFFDDEIDGLGDDEVDGFGDDEDALNFEDDEDALNFGDDEDALDEMVEEEDGEDREEEVGNETEAGEGVGEEAEAVEGDASREKCDEVGDALVGAETIPDEGSGRTDKTDAVGEDGATPAVAKLVNGDEDDAPGHPVHVPDTDPPAATDGGGAACHENLTTAALGGEEHAFRTKKATEYPSAVGHPDLDATATSPAAPAATSAATAAAVAALQARLDAQSLDFQSLQHSLEEERRASDKKVSGVKEEARRRLARAKDRYDEVAKKLGESLQEAAEQRARADGLAARQAESGDSDAVMAALQEEGAALAMKQAAMEQSVRQSAGRCRQLEEDLEGETTGREKAEKSAEERAEKIKELEGELVVVRGEAKGASAEAEKLDGTQRELEEERALRSAAEGLTASLRTELNATKKEAEEAYAEAELRSAEQKQEIGSEAEQRLSEALTRAQAIEVEAEQREEGLRREVSETRRRWQDAMRRSEALSVDMQDSTAPLLRQLESSEKQSRARAQAWAETESKLRHEVDRTITERDRLSKELSDVQAETRRLNRLLESREGEVESLAHRLGAASEETERLGAALRSATLEKENLTLRLEEKERAHTEAEERMRGEMNRRTFEADERRRDDVNRARGDAEEEKTRRKEAETMLKVAEEEGRRLRSRNRRAEAEEVGQPHHEDGSLNGHKRSIDPMSGELNLATLEVGAGASSSSFAVMEQLVSGMKVAKLEIQSLKNQLVSTEES